MKYLSINLPNGESINPPGTVQQGGLERLGEIISNALAIMMILAIILAIIGIIRSGLQWIASGGDKGKIAGARARMTWSIVGLIVALGVFFIINTVGYFFDVNLLDFTP